jgi:aminoglycoside phosphotransferase (APT) family kinase protein
MPYRKDPAVPAVGAVLAEHLTGMTAKLGWSVQSVTPIMTLKAKAIMRGCFQLTLDDGSVMKARVFDRAARAAYVANLITSIASPHMAPIIAVDGPVMIEAWIDGRTVSDCAMSAQIAFLAGSNLAAIHVTPIDGKPRPRGKPEFWRRRLAENLDVLDETREAIAFDLALLRRRMNAGSVDAADQGPIHGDYCAGNLVLTGANAIVAIDNETVRIDAFAYDLGRVAYRWPMEPEMWRAFLDGYETKRAASDFRRNAVFWSLAAMVDGAVFRISAGLDPSVPLARIANTLEVDGDGLAFGLRRASKGRIA